MKKGKWARYGITLLVLAVLLICGIWSVWQVRAAEYDFSNNTTYWPGSTIGSLQDGGDEDSSNYIGDYYISITAQEYPEQNIFYQPIKTFEYNSLLKIVEIPGSDGSNPEDYNLTLTLNLNSTTTPEIQLEKQNYYLPVPVSVTADDGRHCTIFIIAMPENRSFSQEEDGEAFTAAGEKFVEQIKAVAALRAKVKNITGEVGGYQRSTYRMLGEVLFSVGRYPRWGSIDEFSTVESAAKLAINGKTLDPNQMAALADTVIPYYLEYAESSKIQEPEIKRIAAGNTQAIQINDEEWQLTMPAGTDWSKVEASVVYGLNGTDTAVVTSVRGIWENDSNILLTVSARDPATVDVYNKDTKGFVTRDYVLHLKTEEPYLEISSFQIGSRQAEIDQDTKTIALHLESNLSWTNVPVVDFTPGCTLIYRDAQQNEVKPDANGAIDFSKAKTVTVQADLSDYQQSSQEPLIYEKSYTINLTQGNSDECEILSYSLGVEEEEVVYSTDENGNGLIQVTIPYSVPWDSLTPRIEASLDASVTAVGTVDFEHSEENPIQYIVKSQSGLKQKTYYVTVKKTAASQACDLLTFRIGSVNLEINQQNRTVTGQMSVSSLKNLKPEITISPLATVSPASGEAVDFTSPVTYTVTAQDGTVKTYTVTVTKKEVTENPYTDQMKSIVSTLVSQFKSREPQMSDSDGQTANWERMNIGLWENIPAMTPPELPDGFRLALQASGSKTTDYQRATIALTANGVDASRLGQYGDGSVDKDLISLIAQYKVPTQPMKGDFTNAATFALIALDMGNYTLPADSVFSREAAVEFLLSCDLGMQSVDMTSMMMQALAPYRNDAVYGERVQKRYEEYVDWLLGEMNDYYFSFGSSRTAETQCQVICALCAIGIDPHTDSRFTDGTNSVLTRLLEFWTGTGFTHTLGGAIDWGFAQNQGCYTLQWYLGFLENGSQPYSLYYPNGPVHDFSHPLNTEAEILSFRLENKEGVIDQNAATITVTLPAGTPLQNLTPEIEVTEGGKLVSPSLPYTFVRNGDKNETVEAPFTVQAQDGETEKTYMVKIILDDDMLTSAAELKTDTLTLTDSLGNVQTPEISISKSGNVTRIELSVKPGVDLTKLYLAGEISYGATVTPSLSGETQMDLSSWTAFTVKAQDGTEQIYEIRAVTKPVATIARFSVTINGIEYVGAIEENAGTGKNRIVISGVPADADVTALTPAIELGEGTLSYTADPEPVSGIAQDFSEGRTVKYTVTGTGRITQTYEVSVTDADGNPIAKPGSQPSDDEPAECRITAFSINGVAGVIDEAGGTITVTLDSKTNITQLTPVITVSAGASISPSSGQTVNFQTPVVYTVTNGSQTKQYVVTVILQVSLSDQMWDKLAEENTIVDHQVSHDNSFLSR